MANELLVDSCAYFRLARVITPLLGVAHCPTQPFVIYVVPQLDHEYSKSPGLRSKFSWVNDPVHSDNRKACGLKPPKNLSKFDLDQAIAAFTAFKRQQHYGISDVDVMVLSVAYTMDIPIITDDAEMIEVAKQFELIEPMSSLETLEWLYSSGVLTIGQIKTAAQTWKDEKDLPLSPSAFVAEFLRMFQVRPW